MDILALVDRTEETPTAALIGLLTGAGVSGGSIFVATARTALFFMWVPARQRVARIEHRLNIAARKDGAVQRQAAVAA